MGLIEFEDEHVLVVHKPAGINTHSPSPYAGEGIYEWLRHREPRWAQLAIIHRLDKETSGLMVFSKSTLGNRSLTEQFTRRSVRKRYVLASGRKPAWKERTVLSAIGRQGERYTSRPWRSGEPRAETHFHFIASQGGRYFIEAEPVTGRTHQIRVHAAAEGVPVIGDGLYGGEPAERLWLHAAELGFELPGTQERRCFRWEPDFSANSRKALREAFIALAETDAHRLVHGGADRFPGWYLDRLGDFALSQSQDPRWRPEHERYASGWSFAGVYHKQLRRDLRTRSDISPQLTVGSAAPGQFIVRENGIWYAIRFGEGYSVGLFLDQRDNRRRFLVNHVGAGFPIVPDGWKGREVLNTFAYTCGFSVCAARAGARVTSLDLSAKYLEWGKENFRLNTIDPAGHDFLYGDVFQWMRRLRNRERRFAAVILDPPTFSLSKESGRFQVQRDYAHLVKSALPLLAPGGVLLACSNSASWKAEAFVTVVADAIAAAGRGIAQQFYAPQPIDFPADRTEPPYFKSLWLRVN